MIYNVLPYTSLILSACVCSLLWPWGKRAYAKHELRDPIQMASPTGRFSGAFLGPPTGAGIAVQVGTTVYKRISPGEWKATTQESIEHWSPRPTVGPSKLRTGEQVHGPIRVGDRWLGKVQAGVVESPDAFKTLVGPPARFGLARVLAAVAVGQPKRHVSSFWVATDTDELSRCGSQSCKTVLRAPIRALQSFEDGIDLAGDAEGGIWRFEDDIWIRQKVSDSSIYRLDGVVNGGPRFAFSSTGGFLSEDHGRTWKSTAEVSAAYAWGPGGRRAWRSKKGKLQVVIAEDELTYETEPPLRPEATIMWAAPGIVVIDDRDGVHIVEIDRSYSRFLRSNAPSKPTVHTAIVRGSELHIVAGERLQYYVVPAIDKWGMDRLMAATDGEALVFLVVFVIGLALLWLIFDIGLRRRRTMHNR